MTEINLTPLPEDQKVSYKLLKEGGGNSPTQLWQIQIIKMTSML